MKHRIGWAIACKLASIMARLVSFRLRTLKLLTPDDNIITLPHSVIWTESISNANDGALEAQVAVDVYVAHDADIQAAVKILYLAAYTSKYTQLKLPITVRCDRNTLVYSPEAEMLSHGCPRRVFI